MVTGLLQGNNLFVWTLSNGPCDGTADTVLVYVKDCLTLVIPNAFSPNGDGTNDTYVITNIENYQNNTFTVFNRWGNKVFESTPYVNTWDGTSPLSPMCSLTMISSMATTISTFHRSCGESTSDRCVVRYFALNRTVHNVPGW